MNSFSLTKAELSSSCRHIRIAITATISAFEEDNAPTFEQPTWSLSFALSINFSQ